MTHIHHMSRYFALGLMLALLSGLLLFGLAQAAQAARRRARVSGQREFRDTRYQPRPRLSGPRPGKSKLCRAITGWWFTAAHDTTSPEASGTARMGRVSPSLRLRSVFSCPSCPLITRRYG